MATDTLSKDQVEVQHLVEQLTALKQEHLLMSKNYETRERQLRAELIRKLRQAYPDIYVVKHLPSGVMNSFGHTFGYCSSLETARKIQKEVTEEGKHSTPTIVVLGNEEVSDEHIVNLDHFIAIPVSWD
jgi:hypothetical protein